MHVLPLAAASKVMRPLLLGALVVLGLSGIALQFGLLHLGTTNLPRFLATSAPMAFAVSQATQQCLGVEEFITISVIAAACNQTASLLRVIPSWLAANDISEVVLLDWASEPPLSSSHVPADSRLRLVRVEAEREWHPARAYNLALQLARGDSVLILNADVVVAPTIAAQLLPASQGAMATTRSSCVVWYADPPIGTLAMRRECLSDLQGWDERLPLPRHASPNAAMRDLQERARLRGYRRVRLDPNTSTAWVDHPNIARVDDGLSPLVLPAVALADEHNDDAEDASAAHMLLRSWDSSGLASSWKLSAANSSSSSGWWCVATSVWRTPIGTALLPNASEHARAARRLGIFRLARRAVPWPVVQRLHATRELIAVRALLDLATRHHGSMDETYHHGSMDEAGYHGSMDGPSASLSSLSNGPGVGRVLLVHVQGTLPRRLLAVCSASSLASEWHVPLAVAWSGDAQLRARFDDLFGSPRAGTPLDGALHLRAFMPALAPTDLFERWEQVGSDAQRRANRVRRPTGERGVYIRAAGPIEASPAVDPVGVRACLRSLRPRDDAAGALDRMLAMLAPDRRPQLGVHMCVPTSRDDGATGTSIDALENGDTTENDEIPPDAVIDLPGRPVTSAAGPPTVQCTADANTVRAHQARLAATADDDTTQRAGLEIRPPSKSLDEWTTRLPPPLIATSECPAGSAPAITRTLAGASCEANPNCTAIAAERRDACADPASAACSIWMIAEWQLLSRHTSALLLTTGSHFSRLVASTAPPTVSVHIGCKTSNPQWTPRPWEGWPHQPPATLTDGATGGEHTGRLDHMVVNDAAKLIFCWMPKVACTSWKMWLRALAGAPDPLNTHLAHAKGNGLRSLADVSAVERGGLFANYTKVVFVRDPWSRALSAYLNKFVQEAPERRRAWRRELLRPLRALRPSSRLIRLYGDSDADADGADGGAPLSFEAFVSILEETQRAAAAATRRGGGGARLPNMNEHWATQSDLCGLHTLRYDFVGRHDAGMGRDVIALGSLLATDATPPRGEAYGWAGNGNASRLLARHFRRREMIRRVAAIYREDVGAPLNGVAWSAREVFGKAWPAA